MQPEDLTRDSPIPLYFQLQELLKEKIEAGAWGPGEMIPSEPELCDVYGVSRTVVRQALSVLEQDGQLLRVRGRGTFVATPKVEQRVGGVSRLLTQPIPGHQLEVIDHRLERAPRRVAQQLELDPGDEIVRVMTLLRVDGAPVSLFDSFFPQDAATPLRAQLTKQPPSVLTPNRQTAAMDFAHTQVSIETSFCSKWEAEQLQIPVRGAVFVTLCTEFRRQGAKARPCEVVRGVYRVDRVQLRFEVPASGEVPAALWQIANK